MATDEDVEELFDVLTGNRCESHADIARLAGWPSWKPGAVLSHVRTHSDEWGFTIPHVARGVGEHLYQVVSLESGTLDADETEHIRKGAVSTLSMVATESMNEVAALNVTARHVPMRVARKMRRTAKMLEGAAVMAEDARETLEANGV